MRIQPWIKKASGEVFVQRRTVGVSKFLADVCPSLGEKTSKMYGDEQSILFKRSQTQRLFSEPTLLLKREILYKVVPDNSRHNRGFGTPSAELCCEPESWL